MDQSELDVLLIEIQTMLRDLQDMVLKAREPAQGPYAFFHYCSHTLTRTRDVGRTITRLLDGRSRLTDLAFDDEAIPESSQTTQHMRQDFETLYLFGQMLLDQWSHVAIKVGGLGFTPGGAGPFVHLVKEFERGTGGPLTRLWGELHEPMLWLYWQLRLYRNIFIIHADRPWQRGTTASMTGTAFRLFTPAPVGWADYQVHESQVSALWERTPDAIRRTLGPGPHPRGVILAHMFKNIGQIDDQPLRGAIGKCFGEMGGETPSFQTVASTLLEFIRDGTKVLLSIAATRVDEIDLTPGLGAHYLEELGKLQD